MLYLAATTLSLALALQSPAALQQSTRPLMSAQRRSVAAAVYMQVEEEAMSEEEFLAMEEEGMSEEEYEAELVQEEQQAETSADAQRVLNNMKSESGVEFAPWMKVDAEAIAKAKKEREERKAKAQAQNIAKDSMLIDPQAAELGGGGGLKSKVISEDEIELTWDTQDETGNAGFIVQRRQGGASNFNDIASFETFSPLRSRGPAGGTYSYLDDTVPEVGTWVYRILDCDTSGARSAVCQKLVEVESKSEQTQTLIVGALALTLAAAAVAAGLLADPIQTTATGRF